MSPEKQRIAIAEACGIKLAEDCPECYGVGRVGSEGDCWPCDHCEGTGKAMTKKDRWSKAPDYLGDLNAMHAAEKMLDTDKLKLRYQMNLMKPMKATTNPGATFLLFHATAAQRAEAFLRTIGKWEGGAS